MTTETKTVTVEIDPLAQQVLDNMRSQMQAVEAVWESHDPKRVLKMATSLSSALTQLSSWGNAKVFKDSDLSLLVITPHITFGLIGHRDFRPDERHEDDPTMGWGFKAPLLGRFCWGRVDAGLGDGGFIYCMKPIVNKEPTCEGHILDVFATPIPVNWSYHS